MTVSSDIAFTPAVKAEQQRRGSRAGYARLEAKGGWPTVVTDELAELVGATRSFFLATASKEGQPYIQHRGGPKGFLRVLDEHTLAFADFSGNKQYITSGNLSENARACIFIMDWEHRQRVKIWGEASVVEGDADLNAKLALDYDARVLQAIVFRVKAWDANCPQHIPQMLYAEDVAKSLYALQSRIEVLERENAFLRGQHIEPAPELTEGHGQ